MLENISNIGTPLNKKEQKSIHGGLWRACSRELLNDGCYDSRLGCVCDSI